MPAIDLDKQDKPDPATAGGLVIAVIISVIVDGFVIRCLWKWFVVPLGVHPIGVAHAIGLDALWRAFAPNPFSKSVSVADVFARMFYRACAVLSVGYVAHLVMG